MSELNHNSDPQLDPVKPDQETASAQNMDNRPSADNPQYNNGQPCYGADANYNDGQYYNGQPYCDPNVNYNSGQPYCGQNPDYSNNQQYYGQPYYDPNNNYNNGQPYYGQTPNYNNGQPYYGQNPSYNNGQPYYGQNSDYNNGQPYYNPNAGYPEGQPQPYGYYGQQPYANPQAAWQQPQSQPVRQPVSNIFYNIMMVLFALSTIISIIAASGLIRNVLSTLELDSFSGQDYASLYSHMMDSMMEVPGYAVYSTLSSLLGMAVLVFAIIDIIQVHKNGYPVLGLILFTILLRPGYFIWRAHVVNQKKLVPILYTVAYVLVYVIYFFWCFFYMISLL